MVVSQLILKIAELVFSVTQCVRAYFLLARMKNTCSTLTTYFWDKKSFFG